MLVSPHQQVWDMDIGDCILQLRPAEQVLHLGVPVPAQPQPLTCLAVTQDGCCCLCGDAEGWLTCWNLTTGTMLQRLRAHSGRVHALALDSSGSRCLTAGQDAVARLWALPVAAPRCSTGGPGDAAAAAAGPALVGFLALEMELTTPGERGGGTAGAVLDVCLSADGVLGASAGDDFALRVWDLGRRVCLNTCKGHIGWVVSTQVRRVAAAADGAGRMRAHMLAPQPACGARAAASIARTRASPAVARACMCARACVLFVQFLGRSHMLVSASHDATARVWDAWTGDCVAVLQGHAARLNSVVASRSGSLIVTCSDDNTARVWDGNTYRALRCGIGPGCVCVCGTRGVWFLRNIALACRPCLAPSACSAGPAL
jgi:WD40 repeat protein